MIFDRVGAGGRGRVAGVGVPDGGRVGPDQVGMGQLGARQGQQGPDGGRGTGGKIVGWEQDGGVGALGWDIRQGWGSRQGMGF